MTKALIKKGSLLLAPMEDVTDQSFRIICKRLGADYVFTEFVNAEGLIRNSEKTHKKMFFSEEERPVGIQLYGGNIDSVTKSVKIAETLNPDFIDLNCGCWVKNVVGHGAGSALLKDIPYMIKMIDALVKNTTLPVTVKTRLGWDKTTIKIVELAKMIEDTGAKALTVHCRTRQQGHKGEADWLWINRIKEKVKMPLILNGGVMTPEDVRKAFQITECDAVMIARGAINNPFIFMQAKSLLKTGSYQKINTIENIVKVCLEHLELAVQIKGEKKGVIEFRKHYAGYFKGLFNASKLRTELMAFTEFNQVRDHINKFVSEYER